MPRNPAGAGPLAMVWGLPTRLTWLVTLPVNLIGNGDCGDSFDGSEVLTVVFCVCMIDVDGTHGPRPVDPSYDAGLETKGGAQ